MVIQSTLEQDIRSDKSMPGAYEWWYFDAVSDDGSTELVVIFYDGNPFSRRYIQRQQNGGEAKAGDFPAISISIYHNHDPIYYSFTEVGKDAAQFDADQPFAKVGDHKMEGCIRNGKILYTLRLKEKLPSGDAIVGSLQFEAPDVSKQLGTSETAEGSNHHWNVVQPRARVWGNLRCFARNESTVTIDFEGTGYHDHNVGKEPLKERFTDWYWGRFHFEHTTLVYYLMDEAHQNTFAWLISNRSQEILRTFNQVKLEDTSRSLYGLSTARRLTLSSADAHIMVQQVHLLDNGPFYQRFSGDAFLNIPEEDIMQSARGITEYLSPPRIYRRLFWPLTNMRIWYQKESPHWVQRSKMLYRWTW